MHSKIKSFLHTVITRPVAILILSILVASCSRIPDHVIKPDSMAELLVDIYKSESVIELQRSRYHSDSLKSLFRQSVYQAHNVTREMVDTSYVWYGQHIEEYLKVHEKTIEILEKQLAEETGKKIIFAEGDSINVWPLQQSLRVTPQSPTHIFRFNLPIDQNSLKGDNYNLKFKPLPTPYSLQVISTIFANYDDGTIEYKYAETVTDDWAEIRFVSDSTKTANAIYGYIYIPQSTSDILTIIDSISLVRTRVQPYNYSLRYGHRRIHNILPIANDENLSDSITVNQ